MDETHLEYYGPAGKLFKRELLTGRGHTLPFFARYLEPINRGELTLDSAVEQFLT